MSIKCLYSFEWNFNYNEGYIKITFFLNHFYFNVISFIIHDFIKIFLSVYLMSIHFCSWCKLEDFCINEMYAKNIFNFLRKNTPPFDSLMLKSGCGLLLKIQYKLSICLKLMTTP